MKHFGQIYLFLFLLLTTQIAWGQTKQDSTARPVDSLGYKTVVSDRINEAEDRERGPSLSKLLKKADESLADKKFSAAMKYYGYVLHAENLNVEALKGYGESALGASFLDSAEYAFQRLVDYGLSPSPNYFPKMQLAEVKYRKGQYTAAFELYNEIATIPQTPAIPDELKRRAKEQMELCLWAQGAGLDNPYIVKGDTCYFLDTANVNIKDDKTEETFAEYVSNVQDGQLYFSAYRFDSKKDRSNPKRNTLKILKAEDARKPLGPNVPMTVTETAFNDSKRQHSAHLTFDEAGNTAYYALGDYVGSTAVVRFDLYRRKMQPDSTWGPPEKLNAINAVGFTTTEPSLGTLSGDKTETLFFVSDRPGGKGGRDIWSSKIVGDSLTTPLPLTEVNTNGNDVTPFFHTPSNTLFFSSDSLKSLGGFDIHKTKPLKNGLWSKPEHMGSPINSSANEAFFILDKNSQRGFFSSNRKGSINYSEEDCCYDIYSVDFITRYRAIALHALTLKPLPLTSITLYESNSAKKLLNKLSTPPVTVVSAYTYDVRLNQHYAIVGEKAGFIPDTVTRKTLEELWTNEIADTVRLMPILNIVASVYDSLETSEPIKIFGAKFTFFDLGAQDKAGNFVRNDNPGKVDVLPGNSNTQSYKLEFGHIYRVLAAKEGYVAATSKSDSSAYISTIGLVDGGTIEAKLYLHKPSALELYLPISLYFDNDYPKKTFATDSMLGDALIKTDPFLIEMKTALAKNFKDPLYHDTILIDYKTTQILYLRRQEKYVDEYSSGLTGQTKQAARDSMTHFFDADVRTNWDSFFALSDEIDLMLKNGDTIILTLKGFASPLSNPEYNKHLTNRRIASVYNHFMFFDDKAFKKYREVVGTGQLRFIREPNGDEESRKQGVNGNPKDLKKSVYDLAAARSRRVEIIGARVTKGSNVKSLLGKRIN